MMNSSKIPHVMGISTIKDEERISANFQQRDSIDGYYDRVSSTEDIIEGHLMTYRNMDIPRRYLSELIFDYPVVEWLSAFPAYRAPCNADPLAYINPMVDSILQHFSKYSLEYFTIDFVSLLSSEIILNTLTITAQ